MDGKIEVRKIILIFVVTIFFILLLGLLFYKNMTKSITIEAVVKEVGDETIIVFDKNEDVDYLLETTDEYNVNDVLLLTLSKIDEDVDPREATIERVSIVSRSISFTIEEATPEVKDESISDNNTNVDSDTNNDNTVINNNTDDNISNKNENNNYTEKDVIEYFENIDKSIDINSNDTNVVSSIKSGFVNVVDFLFYDKEIKGKTFKELSTGAKLKVLSLALSIDSKIDSKIPGYKDSLSDKYNNVKSKIVSKYLDITYDVCSKNEDTCNSAKEGLSNLKESFSITWTFIKDMAGVGASKLKNWYEVWRSV